MANRAAALKKPSETSKLTTKPGAGRVFTISMKGIPRVDAQTKARVEAAARKPDSPRRDYPKLSAD